MKTDIWEKWIQKNRYAIVFQDEKKHAVEVLGFFGAQLFNNYKDAQAFLELRGFKRESNILA